MPKNKTEVSRMSVHTKNGQINIVVFERTCKGKGGTKYYTEAYDTRAERVLGVSTEEYRAADSTYTVEEVVARVIYSTHG